MTVKIRLLVTKFLPLISQLGELQKTGVSGLSQKSGYAISKNFNQAIDLIKEYNREREKLIPLYVKMEAGKPVTEKREDGNIDYVFKSDTDKNVFLKELESLMEREVEFKPFKFSEEELDKGHNIPVDIMAVMDEMEMITTVSLVSGMKAIH